MHELSLMADCIRKLNEVARTHPEDRIIGVCFRLGALSHISANHFEDHFRRAVESTPAAGAHVRIEASDDTNDPHAFDVILESIELETAPDV